MPRNIEIKARLENLVATEIGARRIADGPPEEIRQEDIFFNTTYGRLKLRISDGNRGELISYERENRRGPKLSTYLCVPTDRPAELRQALANACGIRGVVRKIRRVYRVGNTRIHLDEVEHLGHFLELEVVLSEAQEPAQGQRTAERLMVLLGIRPENLIDCAYIDLLPASVP